MTKTHKEKPKEVKIYKFVDSGESYYPIVLRLELNKRTLWDLVTASLSFLKWTGGEQKITGITLFGTLTEEDE